jgi:flagellar protein FlaG
MITPVPNIGPTPDPAKVRAASPEAAQPVAKAEKPKETETKSDEKPVAVKTVGALRQPVPAYDLRLTVDKDPETGEVVYKSINRLTGEVVKQMPNAEVMAMKRREMYEAGSIFVTDV